MTREARIHARGGQRQMPALGMGLKPPGRKPRLYKAKRRFTGRVSPEQSGRTASGTISAVPDERDLRDQQQLGQQLEDAFADAAAGRTKQSQIDLEAAFNQAASGDKGEDGRGSSDGPKPEAEKNPENKIRRYGPKQSKDKDLDRGR